VTGFQGVGGVDLVLHQPKTTDFCGLIECKWSVDLKRDKIYEGAWDAIRLSLAEGDVDRWLVTGAPAQAWSVACILEAWSRLQRALAAVGRGPGRRNGPARR